MKNIFILAVFCLAVLNVRSQTPDPESMRMIDSALEDIGLSRENLRLIPLFEYDDGHSINFDSDATPGIHYLENIKSLENVLYGFNKSEVDRFAGEICHMLRLKDYVPYTYKTNIPAERIHEELGIKLDTVYDNLTVLALRDVLMPLVQINEFVRDDPMREVSPILLDLIERSEAMIFAGDADMNDFQDLLDYQYDKRISAEEFYRKAQIVRMTKIYDMGFSLLRTYLEVLEKLTSRPDLFEGDIRSIEFESPMGRIAIGGKGDDNYAGDYIFIIDFGGNDTYALARQTFRSAVSRPVSAIIDLAGDDIYSSGDYSLGGAMFGINLLLDYSGNDKYTGGNVSLGAALFGIGALIDFSGDDTYVSGRAGQGFAALGSGMLIDRKGDDSYSGGDFCQGVSGVRGIAALADNSGSDEYSAGIMSQGASAGWYHIAAGGLGVLADSTGDDRFVCKSGQGAALWLGIASLGDRSGDDIYISQDFAQAAALAGSVAFLNDKSGNDRYITGGSGLAWSSEDAFAYFHEFSGDDVYISQNINHNEISNSRISIFLDNSGNDAYSNFYINDIFAEPDFPILAQISLRIDGEGNDLHDLCEIDSVNLADIFFSISKDFHGSRKPRNQKSSEKADGDISQLFDAAAGGHPVFSPIALKELIARGNQAAPYLYNEIGSVYPARRKAAIEALSAMAPKFQPVRKAMLDSVKSLDVRTALSSAEILSKANIEAARPEFINLSGYGDWRLRAASAFALRHFDDSASFRAIKGMLRDSHPLVRANAAFSIGALLPEGAVDTLAPAFDDPANYASGAAIAGIMQNTAIDYELCEKIFFGEYPDKLKQALAPIAARCEFDKKELRGFAKQFTSLNAGLRMAILKSMIITDYARNKEHIELLLAKEENKGIVNKAEQLIQLLSIRKEK